MHDLETAFAHSAENEQLVRCRLNLVFAFILTKAKFPYASAMSFHVETAVSIKKKFDWKGPLQTREISGKIDYGLWYKQPELLENNLVVVEAKRRGEADMAEPQLLTYVGKWTS